jgi:hypothetical protein
VGASNPHPGRGFRAGPVTPRVGAPTPAPAPAPAVAPAPAPAPRVAATPTGDAGYNSNLDLIKREEETALSGLRDSERRTKFDFGIDDPTNPNSRMMGLKNAWLAHRKGTSAGLANQGHLYSGQHERGLANSRRKEEAATSDLKAQHTDALARISEARKSVQFDAEGKRQNAYQDWLDRQAGMEPDDTEDFGPAPPANAPAAAKAAYQAQKKRAGSAESRAVKRAKAKAKAKQKAHPAPNRRQGSGSTRKKKRR